MSSALMPRLARRARCVRPSQVTSHTSSQVSDRPPSTSLIASSTTNGAAAASGPCEQPQRPARRTCGWTIASRSASAAGSANTMRARAARSSTPAASTSPAPNRAPMAGNAGSPGAVAARASASASMTNPPSAAEHPRHRGLAAADRPGQPDEERAILVRSSVDGCAAVHRGARSDSASQASSAWASGGLDVSQLARQAPQLHEVGLRRSGRPGPAPAATCAGPVGSGPPRPGRSGAGRRPWRGAAGVRRGRALRRPGPVPSVPLRGGAPRSPRPLAVRRWPPRRPGVVGRAPARRASSAATVQPSATAARQARYPPSNGAALPGSSPRPGSTTHSRSHTDSSSRRSCDTTMSVAGVSRRNDSSASRAGMSRWFVGSSRSSRLAGVMPSTASSSRDRSPPDSSLTGLSTSSPRNRNRAR